MSNTYYNSLSGMLAASFGLQNTSNNIANMQSHGFKRSDVFYSSLGNDGDGHGVHFGGSTINFTQGNHAPTGSASDLAIVGQGFFVIRLKNNELVYTRDGNFEFKDGVLVDKHNGGLVQGYDSAGNLVAIHQQGPKIAKGRASHDIYLNGDFAISKDANSNEGPNAPYKNVIFELQNICDERGKAHTIKFEFKNVQQNGVPAKNLWEICDISSSDNIVLSDYYFQQIELKSSIVSPKPTTSNTAFHFTINGTQTVNVNFWPDDDWSDKAVILKEAGETAIQVYQNDGYAEGIPLKYTFDQDGQISYHYNNGQIIKGVHVGLARFDNMDNLVQSNNNFFKAKSTKGIHYGQPNKQGFSAVMPEYLENSNVDSTTEFANIVVLQRMFQACSQIMDIDKQLLQELESKS